MSESSRTSRQRGFRNTGRVSARRALIVDLANRASHVNRASRESLANRAAANVLRVVMIVVNVFRANGRRGIMIVPWSAAAESAAVAAIVRNVRRCASALRWTANAARAKNAVDARLPTGTVVLVKATVAPAKNVRLNAALANMIARAKATAVLVNTTVLRPEAAVIAIMIVRRNVAANATSANAIAITRRAVILAPAQAAMLERDAIILRAVATPAGAVDAGAKRLDQNLEQAGFGPPFLFPKFGGQLCEEKRAGRNRIFAQSGQRNCGHRMKSMHDKSRQSRSDRRAQRFTNE